MTTEQAIFEKVRELSSEKQQGGLIMLASAIKSELLRRKVLLYRDEDGYFVVEVPSLHGCLSQGETREEALINIQEAIALHIGVLQERGEPITYDV